MRQLMPHPLLFFGWPLLDRITGYIIYFPIYFYLVKITSLFVL